MDIYSYVFHDVLVVLFVFALICILYLGIAFIFFDLTPPPPIHTFDTSMMLL